MCEHRQHERNGQLSRRGDSILAQRLQCAWSKFHLSRTVLTNKHVDVRLRLRLFNAVVTPSAVCGLSTAPLTAAALERLAVAQRKMFSLMVGYMKTLDDFWADMHRRLSAKIGRALERFPVRLWKEELAKNKRKLATKIASGCAPELVQKIHVWNPSLVVDEKLSVRPRRRRGRPPVAWNNRST